MNCKRILLTYNSHHHVTILNYVGNRYLILKLTTLTLLHLMNLYLKGIVRKSILVGLMSRLKLIESGYVKTLHYNMNQKVYAAVVLIGQLVEEQHPQVEEPLSAQVEKSCHLIWALMQLRMQVEMKHQLPNLYLLLVGKLQRCRHK